MFCGQTIYVVDDDKPALDSLSLLLTAEGYAVRSHESAGTFLDAIKQNERGCATHALGFADQKSAHASFADAVSALYRHIYMF